MSRITKAEAQAWAEGTKLTISTLNTDLLDHIEEEVLRTLTGFDSTTWTNENSTPKLVRTIIAKLYIAWEYDKAYSEDIDPGSNYADRLRTNANNLLAGLIAGTIELPGVPDVAGSPVFYPTDASSALPPTADDSSLGPAAFSMGMRKF